MTAKRYQFEWDGEWRCSDEQAESSEYVLAEDYDKLEVEISRLRGALEALDGECLDTWGNRAYNILRDALLPASVEVCDCGMIGENPEAHLGDCPKGSDRKPDKEAKP